MSKLLDELDKKITAIEQLEHMMKLCDYQIVSCSCFETQIVIYWESEVQAFIVTDPEGIIAIDSLAYAIKKFAELTEH